MRPLRLSASRALGLASAESNQPAARRAATTSASPAPDRPAAAKPSYARASPATNGNTGAGGSPSSSTSKPSYSAYSPATPKTANTPFAESQINPVAPAPYNRPQGMGAIPEAPTAFSQQQQQPQQQQQQQHNGNGNGNGEASFASNGIDWTSSYHGLSTIAFNPDVAAMLMKPIPFEDVEIKPDGIIYLPEIKYRRILNQAFGPGGWGMAPRSELGVGDKVVTREYALLVHGRYVCFFSPSPPSSRPSHQFPHLPRHNPPPSHTVWTRALTPGLLRRRADSSPRPAASARTSPTTASPPPGRAASPTP